MNIHLVQDHVCTIYNLYHKINLLLLLREYLNTVGESDVYVNHSPLTRMSYFLPRLVHQ